MIDIIIPFYNTDEQLFLRCIDSLAKQSARRDMNIYIVDDCSTNINGLNHLKNYDSIFNSIVILHNENNYGPGRSRNRGFQESSSEYVMYIDSDDRLPYIETVKILSDSLNINKEIDMAFGYHVAYQGNGTKETFLVTENLYNVTFFSPFVEWVNFKGFMYRRDFLIKNNIYFDKGWYCEEALFFSRVSSARGNALFIPFIAYERVFSDNGMTHIPKQLYWIHYMVDFNQWLFYLKNFIEEYLNNKRTREELLDFIFEKYRSDIKEHGKHQWTYLDVSTFFYLKISFNYLNHYSLNTEEYWEKILPEYYNFFKENKNFIFDSKEFSMKDLEEILKEGYSQDIEEYKHLINREGIGDKYLNDCPWNDEIFKNFIY